MVLGRSSHGRISGWLRVQKLGRHGTAGMWLRRRAARAAGMFWSRSRLRAGGLDQRAWKIARNGRRRQWKLRTLWKWTSSQRACEVLRLPQWERERGYRDPWTGKIKKSCMRRDHRGKAKHVTILFPFVICFQLLMYAYAGLDNCSPTSVDKRC